MMNTRFSHTMRLVALGLCLPLLPLAAQEVTDPVGYMTLRIEAGNGSLKRQNALSIALGDVATEQGEMTGALTGVTSHTLINQNAGWEPGALSSPAGPYYVRLTSGAGKGRTFLISTTAKNSATVLTIGAEEIAQGSLTALGIRSGDRYEILPCDTLATFFGTPQQGGIRGGAALAQADHVTITTSGAYRTFFFNTALNHWVEVGGGNRDASNTPLRPDNGVWFYRLGPGDLELTVTGRVPVTSRTASVANAGQTLLSQSWPIDITLGQSRIAELPGWTAAPLLPQADVVQLVTRGEVVNYWYDGKHWRKSAPGYPLADTAVIPAGSAALLYQRGRATGVSALMQPLPYPLGYATTPEDSYRPPTVVYPDRVSYPGFPARLVKAYPWILPQSYPGTPRIVPTPSTTGRDRAYYESLVAAYQRGERPSRVTSSPSLPQDRVAPSARPTPSRQGSRATPQPQSGDKARSKSTLDEARTRMGR